MRLKAKRITRPTIDAYWLFLFFSLYLLLFLILILAAHIFIIYYLQIVDAILSNANESLAIGSCVIDANAHTASLSNNTMAAAEQLSPHSTMTAERSADEVKQKIQIPTAIVKPKYQKAAFDDRQLPIIACVDRNEPWYDRQCATSENPTIKKSIKKVVQLAEGERKVKKRSKQHQHPNTVKSAHHSSADHKMINVRNGNGSATKEQSKALNAFEKDTNSRRCMERKASSVAVVQPRRKEKMDERKLMETIVQMQIKKNSMDTRNNNQRNGPQNALPTTTAKKSTLITSESPMDASGIHSDRIRRRLFFFLSFQNLILISNLRLQPPPSTCTISKQHFPSSI